jgi:hypothetical protein
MGRQENRNFPSQGAGDLLWFTSRGRPTDQAYWPNGLPGPAQEYGRNPVVACTDETGYTHDKQNRNLPYKYGGTRYQESAQSKYRPHIIHNTVYVGLQHFPSLPLTPQRSRKGYDWKQEP